MAIGWKNEKAWAAIARKRSNKVLIESYNAYKQNPGRYRGTVLGKVFVKEMARRKASGQMRKTAGKPRQSTGFQLLSLSGRII